MRLILASQSPRRKELLSSLGVEFETVPADVEEHEICYYAPQTAQANAILKAEHIAALYPDDLVLGSDTVVEYKEHILGKPKDLEHARKTLRTLSGKEHLVVTAVALRSINNAIKCDYSVTTKVKFKELTDETIEQYISLVNTLDKAGAYGIQSRGELLVESIDGPMDNVIGLPCERLKETLTHLGILI